MTEEVEMKKCTRCKVSYPKDSFPFKNSLTHTRRAICTNCNTSVTAYWKTKERTKYKKPEFLFPVELVDWYKAYSKMPNKKGQLQTIRAYSLAGMDEDNLIIGREIERVCNPLFGNPML